MNAHGMMKYYITRETKRDKVDMMSLGSHGKHETWQMSQN